MIKFRSQVKLDLWGIIVHNLISPQCLRDRCVWPRYRKERVQLCSDWLFEGGVFIAVKCRGSVVWKLSTLKSHGDIVGKNWAPCKMEPNIRQLSVSNSLDWSRSLLGNLLRLRHGALAKVVGAEVLFAGLVNSEVPALKWLKRTEDRNGYIKLSYMFENKSHQYTPDWHACLKIRATNVHQIGIHLVCWIRDSQ